MAHDGDDTVDPAHGAGEAARPFYRLLGIELVDAADGRSTLRLPGRAEIANSRGDTHGGAVATLLDAAMASAGRSALGGAAVATSTIAITYLAPGRGDLFGTGLVVRAGRTIVAASAEVRDSGGLLVAQAQGTLRVMARRR